MNLLAWARGYDRAWLRGDMTAGAIVAALAVPQSLGYAAIAGVPCRSACTRCRLLCWPTPSSGRRASWWWGRSRPCPVLSGSLVASRAPETEAEAVAYTVALALGSGLVLIALGLLRIGWIAEFLSKPIVTGFVFGLTILVIVGEIPKMVGVPRPRRGRARAHRRPRRRLPCGLGSGDRGHRPGVPRVLFGLGAVWPRVPWALVLVVAAIVASSVANWEGLGIAVVGEVPAGLPVPGVPDVGVGDLGWLLGAGAALALVGLAEGLSAARLFAARGGYRIDADQDLVASGAANVASGLFGVSGWPAACRRRQRRPPPMDARKRPG